ncbi:MAG: hypothetical protein QXV60_00695 [Nitrososphaerota archaeon]
MSTTTSNQDSIRIEYKRSCFDKEFKALVKQAQEIITTRYQMSIELGEVKPELLCLNKYMSIYNNTKPEEHYCYFEDLYNSKRNEILNTLKDDSWIRYGKITIQFGKFGNKNFREKCKQVRIMLSEIFLIACELQKKAEKLLEGIDEKLIEPTISKDLIRPNIILLHLMRIFYHLNNTEDKEKLGSIVTELENELGITKKTVGSEPWKSGDNQMLTNSGLSSLFSMATAMMEKMGYKPPPGMKPPTESEISSVINSVFNNEATQQAIQSMFSSLQNCQDFTSAIKEVVKNVTDPKTMETLQTSVSLPEPKK